MTKHSASLSGAAKDSRFLVFYSLSRGKYLPTFLQILDPTIIKQSKNTTTTNGLPDHEDGGITVI